MKTPEEIMAELDELGVDLGSWGVTEGGDVEMAGVNRQRDALIRLRTALEGLVENDQRAVGLLYEQMARLEHGGGS